MRTTVGALAQMDEYIIYQRANVVLPLDTRARCKERQNFKGRGDNIHVLASCSMRKNRDERSDIRCVLRRHHGDHALFDVAADAIHCELRKNEVAWMAARGSVVGDDVCGTGS